MPFWGGRETALTKFTQECLPQILCSGYNSRVFGNFGAFSFQIILPEKYCFGGQRNTLFKKGHRSMMMIFQDQIYLFVLPKQIVNHNKKLGQLFVFGCHLLPNRTNMQKSNALKNYT